MPSPSGAAQAADVRVVRLREAARAMCRWQSYCAAAILAHGRRSQLNGPWVRADAHTQAGIQHRNQQPARQSTSSVRLSTRTGPRAHGRIQPSPHEIALGASHHSHSERTLASKPASDQPNHPSVRATTHTGLEIQRRNPPSPHQISFGASVRSHPSQNSAPGPVASPSIRPRCEPPLTPNSKSSVETCQHPTKSPSVRATTRTFPAIRGSTPRRASRNPANKPNSHRANNPSPQKCQPPRTHSGRQPSSPYLLPPPHTQQKGGWCSAPTTLDA